MNKKINNEEYKKFLESKISERNNNIYLSLEKEFLNYLSVAKIINIDDSLSKEKNFTDFFTRLLKNIFFSTLNKKLNPEFLKKIDKFKINSNNIFYEKKFSKVVMISDTKLTKKDLGVSDFANLVTRKWKCSLTFRSLPLLNKDWLVTNLLKDIRVETFRNSIQNILSKFPIDFFKNKFNELKNISSEELNKFWNKFVDSKVWYSFEMFIKAQKMFVDEDIFEKIEEVFSLIKDDTLVIFYNNDEDQNILFHYLFNFENELFKWIENEKNISTIIVSENKIYENTFLGLTSSCFIDKLSNIEYYQENFNEFEKDLQKNEFEDKTDTIDKISEPTGTLDKFWDETGSKKYSTSEFTLDKINLDEKIEDDLINPNQEINLLNKEFEKEINNMKYHDIDFNELILESKKYLFSKLIEYKNKFSDFVNKFNNLKNKYSNIDFDSNKENDYYEFDKNLRKLNIESTYYFLEKNEKIIFDFLNSNLLNNKNFIRCYSIYLHISQNINKIDNLINDKDYE